MLTEDQAIKLAMSEFWKEMTDEQIAIFQINEEKICIPLSIFQSAVEKTLKRSVFLHEFAINRDGIRAEINGKKEPPSFDEIIALIPESKRIIITIDKINQNFE